ncbi:hypothetical protein SDC9_171691 [bioreactor metagenome]|uniref:Uncharacterized protein n=1 Tax=bioreactor metagenome TaxID=1076179 RepID=A0A645GDR6_9ZZZZ
MQQSLLVFRPQPGGNFRHGVDIPRLVVYQHDAHQRRVGPDGSQHRFRGNISVPVGSQEGDLVPVLFQPSAPFQNRAVLHGCGDNVLPHPPVLPQSRSKRPVVGLRAAGGEKQPPRLAAQSVRDLSAAVVHQPPRLPAIGILRAGISILLRQHTVHLVRHRFGHRRGGGVIEIDHWKHSFDWGLPQR